MTICDHCREDPTLCLPAYANLHTPDMRVDDFHLILELCPDCYEAIIKFITDGPGAEKRTET